MTATHQPGVNAADTPRGARGITRITLGREHRATADLTVAFLYSITLLLVGIGLIMVLSSSSITSYLGDQGFFGAFWRQATYAVIGLPLMFVAASMPIIFWKKWAWHFLALGLGLQLLVFSPLGYEVWGNRNWIRIGSITAQPSELLKLALIVWVGAVLLKKEPLLGQTKHELIPIFIPGALIVIGSVMLGHDMGTALMMAGALFGAVYFGGMRLRTLATVGVVGVGLALVFLLSSENRMQRLFGLTEGAEYSGLGWQPTHGLWALAGGGLFGVGLGGSKAKWSWLPAADNDYIFAIIGEELGLIGAVLVIALYVALAAVMLRAIGRARDRFGKAVIGGIMVWIVGQAFVNIGVVIRVLPVLGVPLPLISAGGTALIACLTAIGVVISIARDGNSYQAELARAKEAR